MGLTKFSWMAIVTVALFAQSLFGQGVKIEIIAASAVPSEVVSVFQQNFPSIQAYKWEKHVTSGVQGKEGTKYVAAFNEKGFVNRARYYASGKGVSVTTYFGIKIPTELAEKVKSSYPGYTLTTGEKIRSLVNAKEVFRLRYRKSAQKLVVYVDANGKEVGADDLGEEFDDDGVTQ